MFSANRIIVTGGAGFIGSAVARHIVSDTADSVCVVDKRTYAGNLENSAPIAKSDRFKFEKADICDCNKLDRVFRQTPLLILLKRKAIYENNTYSE